MPVYNNHHLKAPECYKMNTLQYYTTSTVRWYEKLELTYCKVRSKAFYSKLWLYHFNSVGFFQGSSTGKTLLQKSDSLYCGQVPWWWWWLIRSVRLFASQAEWAVLLIMNKKINKNGVRSKTRLKTNDRLYPSKPKPAQPLCIEKPCFLKLILMSDLYWC